MRFPSVAVTVAAVLLLLLPGCAAVDRPSKGPEKDFGAEDPALVKAPGPLLDKDGKAPSLAGKWKGALVLGGRLLGRLDVALPEAAGGVASAPMVFRALSLRTDYGPGAAGPSLRVQIAADRSVTLSSPGVTLGKLPGGTVEASFEGKGVYLAAAASRSRPAVIAIGTLAFRKRGLAERFGGQDMGDFFGGQDMGDFFGGQDMGSYFGGQDMGSYFGGQDMGSWFSARNLATYFTNGRTGEFGGQDMGDFFGGQDMGNYLTAHNNTLRLGIVLLR